MSTLRRAALALLVGLSLAGRAVAQDAPQPDPGPAPAPDAPAPDAPAPDAPAPDAPAPDAPAPVPVPETPVPQAPEAGPPPAGRDRLVLGTGEVLFGEFKQLAVGTYSFKSEVLDATKVPLDKVTEFDAGRPIKVVLKDGRTLEGPARLMGAKTLTVWTAGGPVQVTLDEVEAINPTPPKTELEKWSVKLTLGYTATTGNTNNRTAIGLVSIAREDDWTKLTLGYQGVYGTVSGEESAKSHRGDGQLDVKVTERAFLTPFVGNIYYDKFQNIGYRYRVGSGGGYYLLKDERYYWSAETGFAYGVTRFRRITPGADRHRYETSIRAATRVEVKIIDEIAFKGFYEAYIGAKRVEDTVHHAEAQLSFKYSVWSFDVGVIYDRIEEPQRRADGELPRRDDAKFFVGLGLSI